MQRGAWLIPAVGLGVALLGAGCGTNWQDVLANAGSAAGRSLLDLALTDLANSLAGAGEEFVSADNENDNTDDGSTPPPGLTGDPVAGEALFAGQICISCHCEGAVGGCQLDAPNLAGADYALIHTQLRGSGFHPGGKFPGFTDQNILDLEAYFATLVE